jgi:hypothetical protein
LPSPLSVKLLAGKTVRPLHEVIVASVVYVPHVDGSASEARGPPSKSRCTRENGSCGLSSNVVVNCPVTGSGTTFPGSLMITPGPLATR